MNTVIMIGRLTRDPDVRYAGSTQMAIARFTLAINRGKDRNGKDLGADYPAIVCYGKQAELVERYVNKGMLVSVEGHIKTGSYEKSGQKVYTTDIVADRIGFMEGKGNKSDKGINESNSAKEDFSLPEGFNLDDDIPF